MMGGCDGGGGCSSTHAVVTIPFDYLFTYGYSVAVNSRADTVKAKTTKIQNANESSLHQACHDLISCGASSAGKGRAIDINEVFAN